MRHERLEAVAAPRRGCWWPLAAAVVAAASRSRTDLAALPAGAKRGRIRMLGRCAVIVWLAGQWPVAG